MRNVGLKGYRKWRNAILFVMICWCMGCGADPSADFILNDFETETDLDRINWRCRHWYSLTDAHVSHGQAGLKLDLYPGSYPGLSLMLNRNDWRSFKALRFDVFNPETITLAITVRIDDRKMSLDYGERYNRSFPLKPGWNHLKIPLDTLRTSGDGRLLDLKKILRLLFFIVHTKERHVLYLDHIHLEI